MPGMYAVTSTPVVSRTRATFRRAEFGFFGVVVNTRVHTPRRCGEPFSAGVFDLSVLLSRPLRTSWAIVGTALLAVGVRGTRMVGPGRPEEGTPTRARPDGSHKPRKARRPDKSRTTHHARSLVPRTRAKRPGPSTK